MSTKHVDAEVRRLVAANEVDRATDLVVRAYGGELIRWLRNTLPSDADAYDAFSLASEALWKSLGQFESRCSVRAWFYMLARQASARVWSRTVREELVGSELDFAVSVWRAASPRHERVYDQIRQYLDDDEELLLTLRVDRGLLWREVALVLDGKISSNGALVRRTAHLRKQFERIKARLRDLAALEGD